MSDPLEISPAVRRRRWLLWFLFVFLWTTALVVPVPGDTILDFQHIRINVKFVLAKTLHVLAYAGMTILSGRLLIAPRFRWAMMYFLMFHAGLTEIIQERLVYRSGLLMDVMFDSVGVALGVLVSWRHWTAPATANRKPVVVPDEEEACAPVR